VTRLVCVALMLTACEPAGWDDTPFGVGPRDGCDQVYQLVDTYVLAPDRAPADWEPTPMNPDCGPLPPDFPEGCAEIGPRESWDGSGSHCFVHIDYDCEGASSEFWWYTVAAGTDGIVVGAADCGWQVFFDER
jgi:hypothetical protein